MSALGGGQPVGMNGHSNGRPPSYSPTSSSSSPSPFTSMPSLSSSLLLVSSLLFLWLSLDPHRRPRQLRSMLTFGPSALVNEMPHLFLTFISIPTIALLYRHLFSSPSSPSSPLSSSSLTLLASLLSHSLSAASLLTLFLRGVHSRHSFRRALLHPAALSPAAVDVLHTPAPKSTPAVGAPAPLLNPMAVGDGGKEVGGDVVEVKGIKEVELSEVERRQVSEVGSMTAWRSVQMMLPFPALTRWKDGIRVDRGLTFHVVGGLSKLQHLRLDVYHPPQSPLSSPSSSASSTQPLLPCVVYVHGGGWMTGDKSQSSLPMLLQLAHSGVVVATINYRLAPSVRHPQQLIDVKRAIHFLRTHSAQLHVDRALLFLAGDSAGGHLASLAALTAGEAQYQPGFEGADVSVLGVIDTYGVHSFMRAKGGERSKQEDGFMNFLAQFVMPGTIDSRPELYAAASPIHHLERALKRLQQGDVEAGRKVPWFLCVHGHMDTLVPIEDTLRFFSILLEIRQKQVEVEGDEARPPLDVCVDVEGASHAFNLVYTVRSYSLNDAIAVWMQRVLQREGRQPQMGTTSATDARQWIAERSQRIDLTSSL